MKTQRILVVDASRPIHADFRKIFRPTGSPRDIARMETELFGTRSGLAAPTFALDSAYQEQEALTLFQRALDDGQPYGTVFVDVGMPPGWAGIRTAERLLELDPGLHVIACSAYHALFWSDQVSRSVLPDRMVTMKKPFETREVLELATALIRKRERPAFLEEEALSRAGT